jgi:hypothetical protein
MKRFQAMGMIAALAVLAPISPARAQDPAPPAPDGSPDAPEAEEPAPPPAPADDPPPIPTPVAPPGCGTDSDCKGARICEEGRCVAPPAPEPAPPQEPSERERWAPEGRFMDTRITFVMSDDNLLAGTRERSPDVGFGRSNDELFFEGLESEKRGWETETQLVLYKRMPSYFRRLDAEAALVLELENWVDKDTWENETRIGDDGSYLKLNLYTTADDFEGDHVSLTLFPMDSQRFLLGYTYDITWGGEDIFPNKKGQVPGARLMWDFNVGKDHQGYVFAGAKTARLLNTELNEQQTYFGVLGGAGLDLTGFLRFDLNGGYFQRGPFQPADGTELGGETMEAFGGSARIIAHHGLPIANSVDFRLYKVSPDGASLLTAKQAYDGGVAWSLAGEFTYVAQTLLDFGSAEDNDLEIVLQPAMAGAGNGRLRLGRARLHADFVTRNLSYVVFDIPGVFPYMTFPEASEQTPEWFIAGGLDYFFETPRLTPGVIVGFKRPASLGIGDETVVFRQEDDWEKLPAGDAAFDILSAKLTLKWDVAEFFVMAAELRYTRDQNRTRLESSGEFENEGYVRVYEDDRVVNQLGFALLAQARW